MSTTRPIYTGFADEASPDIGLQLKAIRELGWSHLDLRNVSVEGGKAACVHDISDSEFDLVAERVRASGIEIHSFASTIGNWASHIDQPFEISLEALARCIPRMHALNVPYVRVMSYAVRRDATDLADEERIRRLREVVARFSAAGISVLHENCMNYGGLSAEHTLRLVREIPGLRLIFDPGNTVGVRDHSKPEPLPLQSAWEFYERVRDHVDYFHVKDLVYRPDDTAFPRQPVWPGEGEGDLRRILADVLKRRQVHTIAIEPHIKGDPDHTGLEDTDLTYHNFVAYGKRLKALIAELGH